jgi:hypothetical protein
MLKQLLVHCHRVPDRSGEFPKKSPTQPSLFDDNLWYYGSQKQGGSRINANAHREHVSDQDNA